MVYLRPGWDLSFKLFFCVSQGGCISKLEEFILQHLLILGSVGLGIACIQVNNSNINLANIFTHFYFFVLLFLTFDLLCLFQIVGMIFTCCLFRSLKEEIYWEKDTLFPPTPNKPSCCLLLCGFNVLCVMAGQYVLASGQSFWKGNFTLSCFKQRVLKQCLLKVRILQYK